VTTILNNSILLRSDVIYAIEVFNHAVQTTWNAAQTSNDLDINIEYSFVIKGKLIEKRKLCKLWQTNRCSLKTKLNRALNQST